MRGAAVLAGWLMVVSAGPVAAQSEPTTVSDTADRPGFADSARVLGGRGWLQLESGILFEHEGREAASNALTLPLAQLRIGLSSRVDTSIWWDGLVRSSTSGVPDSTTTGGADPRVGGKIRLVHSDAMDLALVASVGLPVGSHAVSSGDADPQARLSWRVKASEQLDVSGTVDVAEDRRDGAWRPRPALSAALNHDLSSHLGSFAGLVVEDGDRGSALHVWSAEAGLTAALGSRRQVDVWAGRRLHGGDPSWFFAAGFVQRLR